MEDIICSMENLELEALQEDISRTEARLAELDDERVQIARRISELKAQLSSLRRSDDTSPARLTEPSGTTPSTSAEKVALFMKLFRGRADVFPKRWENANKLQEILSSYDGPVLVHCGSGNRVGALLALSKSQSGADDEAALAYGRAAGMTGLESVVRSRLAEDE